LIFFNIGWSPSSI